MTPRAWSPGAPGGDHPQTLPAGRSGERLTKARELLIA
jgi:hypothetical protein